MDDAARMHGGEGVGDLRCRIGRAARPRWRPAQALAQRLAGQESHQQVGHAAGQHVVLRTRTTPGCSMSRRAGFG